MQTFDEEITCMLASIDGVDHEEDTKPQDAEPIETYDVYPVQGGMVILKREDEANQQAVACGQPQTTQPPMLPLIVVILCSLFLITGIVFAPNTPPTQQIMQIASLTIPGDIPARSIPPLTETLSQIVPATGRGHSDATDAHGTITFYNGAFTQQFIPQNMIFVTPNGIQIVTDQAVTIPAGTPPSYGETTVLAHALTTGIEGNIPASAINTICCAESVKAINTSPFTGGRNARDYHIVTKEDIDNAVTPLKQAVFHQAETTLQSHLSTEQVFIPLPCFTTTKTNHRSGDEADNVTVTVSETCADIAYSRTSLEAYARHTLHLTTGVLLERFFVQVIAISAIDAQKRRVRLTTALLATVVYTEYRIPRVK